jgi:hypothetical protein
VHQTRALDVPSPAAVVDPSAEREAKSSVSVDGATSRSFPPQRAQRARRSERVLGAIRATRMPTVNVCGVRTASGEKTLGFRHCGVRQAIPQCRCARQDQAIQSRIHPRADASWLARLRSLSPAVDTIPAGPRELDRPQVRPLDPLLRWSHSRPMARDQASKYSCHASIRMSRCFATSRSISFNSYDCPQTVTVLTNRQQFNKGTFHSSSDLHSFLFGSTSRHHRLHDSFLPSSQRSPERLFVKSTGSFGSCLPVFCKKSSSRK